MEYMKFCPHCGNGNEYQMPFCIYCGRPLVMGDSINYKLAEKDFNAYLNAHPKEKDEFNQNHFQICQKCNRKCPLNMDFCAWCGKKLNHRDQYQNYRFIVTTANVIPQFTYLTIGIVSCSIEVSRDVSGVINDAIKNLKNQCVKQNGNTILGFHLLNEGSAEIVAYGTAVNRRPLSD